MRERSRLTFCQGNDGADRRAAQRKLLHEVFGWAEPTTRSEPPRPAWQAFAYFDDDGRCIATAECAILTLVADGRPTLVSGLRLVAVAQQWRGQGLFRDLTERIVAWVKAQDVESLLLYTEQPDLYRRFGFESVPQHAFIGEAPTGVFNPSGRLVSLRNESELIGRLLAERTPPSQHIAIVDAPDLFLERLWTNKEGCLVYNRELDVLVVYEVEDDVLVLLDIVAAAMPTLPQIIGMLPDRAPRVKTLFVPDLLDWFGAPVAEDCGLMALGPRPAVMQRPFILPPTMEF